MPLAIPGQPTSLISYPGALREPSSSEIGPMDEVVMMALTRGKRWRTCIVSVSPPSPSRLGTEPIEELAELEWLARDHRNFNIRCYIIVNRTSVV